MDSALLLVWATGMVCASRLMARMRATLFLSRFTSFGARRFEPHKNRMNFGEMMAVMVVIASVFLLGWEMMHMFKLLPIRIRR
jgi:hypothetical protein